MSLLAKGQSNDGEAAVRHRLAEGDRHAGRLPLSQHALLRYGGLASKEPGAERPPLCVDARLGLALGHGALFPDIRSWDLVRVEIQARWRMSLGAGQACLFRLELSRLGLAPLEARILGHLGLVVVKALDVADLGDDPAREDGAKAGDGVEGAMDELHALGDGGVDAFLQSLQRGDVPQAEREDDRFGIGWCRACGKG